MDTQQQQQQQQQQQHATGYSKDSLEFSICPDEKTLEKTLRNTHTGWGKAFSLETWLANNLWLARYSEYMASHRYLTWVVTSRDDPARAVLCSSAFFTRPALLAYKRINKDKEEEEQVGKKQGSCCRIATTVTPVATPQEDCMIETRVVETKAAHVSMVFTAEEHRGHGYVRWMMQQVQAYFTQHPEFSFTYLYSVAGDMYARMGWPMFPALALEIPVEEEEEEEEEEEGEEEEEEENEGDKRKGVQRQVSKSFQENASANASFSSPSMFYPRPVTDGNLEEAMQWDEAHLRVELARQIEQAEVGTTLVALLPDPACILFHRTRSQFFVNERPPPEQMNLGPFGWILERRHQGATEDHGHNIDIKKTVGYILWSHDFKNNQLILFRLRYRTPGTPREEEDEKHQQQEEDFPRQVAMALLQKALEEAQRWRLPKVTLWNAPTEVEGWLGLSSQERTRFLPCLALCSDWNRMPVSKAPPAESKVEWVLNEFYAY